jgi:hypothetical protein
MWLAKVLSLVFNLAALPPGRFAQRFRVCSFGGITAAAGTFIGAPIVGIFGLRVRERWRGALADVRRFFLLRGNASRIENLKDCQRSLAMLLHDLPEVLSKH